jgi:hypothetical protein
MLLALFSRWWEGTPLFVSAFPAVIMSESRTGAVVPAGLASGLLWLAGGLALGEGGRLALPGAGRLVELAAEALVLGLQVVEALLQGLAAGTRNGLHTSIIGKAPAPGALPQLRSRDQLELDTLIKYIRSSFADATRCSMLCTEWRLGRNANPDSELVNDASVTRRDVSTRPRLRTAFFTFNPTKAVYHVEQAKESIWPRPPSSAAAPRRHGPDVKALCAAARNAGNTGSPLSGSL